MFIQPHIHSPEEKQSVCSKNLILKIWILLDSQSTVDVISNGDLLTKIHRVKTTLRMRCNTGVKTTHFRGHHLSGYGWVWFYPERIANTLSLSRVKGKYRVTFDSATDNYFRVHKDNGKILERVLAVQLVMNVNPDKYGSLIESYDRDFMSGEKIPKKALDAYKLLMGWNIHKHQQGPWL